MIDHFKDRVSLYFSFTSHTFFQKVMSFSFFLLLNDALILQYCFLKFSSAVPRCTLSGLTVVQAMRLYIISLVW